MLAFLAALAVGLCFGLVNGVLVAVFDIPPFIATLGTLGIAQGLSLIVTDGQSVVGIPRSIERIYSGTAGRHSAADRSSPRSPMPLTHVLLYHTRFGTYVFALGGNREALTARRHIRARHADRGLRLRRPDGRHSPRC